MISERPDPPVNVTAFDFGARWVAVRWTPTFDGNSPVLNFILYGRNINTSMNSMGNLTASTLMTTGSSFMFNISRVGVVLPFTEYSFRVASCNEIGCSDQSLVSPTIQTLQDSECFKTQSPLLSI